MRSDSSDRLEDKIFPAILNTLEEPLFLLDNSLRFIWHNKACNDIYYTVSGKQIDNPFDFNELLTAEQQPLFIEHLTRVLGGERVQFEWKYQLSVIKWLSVSLYPFRSCDGSFTGVCGSLRDITEKKINELALLRNTAVLDNISDAVIYTDLDQRVVYFNKSAEKTLGITTKEITGRLISEFVNFEFVDDRAEDARATMLEKGSWQGKLVYTRKDGRKVYLLAVATALRDKNGHCIGVTTTNKDITDEELNRRLILRHQDHITAILNNIPEGVLLIDTHFHILALNQKTTELFARIDRRPAPGNYFIDLLPEERRELVRQYLQSVLTGNTVEYEVLYPDGLWLFINYLPVKDHTGNIGQISINFRDITERKKAEEQIRANEKKYRTLVNSMSEGVILQTPGREVLTLNRNATAILGLEVEELKAKGFPHPGWVIVDENEKEICHEALFYRKNGKVHTVKNKVIGIQRTDRLQWLKLNSAVAGDAQQPEPCALVISFEDITEQKRILGEIAVLALLARETVNAVCILHPDGEMLWMNEGFTRLTGYAPEEMIGQKSRAMLVGPETDLVVLAKADHCRQNSLPFKEEFLIYTKAGKKVWTRAQGQSIRMVHGNASRYFVIVTDITEEKKILRELEVLSQNEIEHQKKIARVILETQELERNELGKELHDNINQILAAVHLQLSHSLKHFSISKPVVKECRENILEAMEETRRLSHKMVMPRLSERSLPKVLKGLVDNYRYAHPIQLNTNDWDDEQVPIRIKEAFYRIVQEQLSNIYKHSRATQVTIRIKSDRENAMLSVEDNGVGFDPAEKKEGIGVSNICSRAESYGGTTQFISSPGKGCRLCVKIPIPGSRKDSRSSPVPDRV